MQSAITVSETLQQRLGTMLTRHAAERMSTRRLPAAAVTAVITYGRTVRTRGAEILAIGRREVEMYEREGIDLSRYEGVQVVCSREGVVLTVYRNRDFRGLRPRAGRRGHRRSR